MTQPIAVIFDLGRVLVRIAVVGEKFGRLMRGFGVEPEQAFATFWNRPEVIAHMVGDISPREFHQAARRLIPDLGYDEFAEGWCDIFSLDREMEALFARVADRGRVGLLSDTDPLHWEKALVLMPWLGRVATPTLSFQVGKLKPHPDMYLAAARNLGRGPEECLFIDDLAANVQGARDVGMRAIRFIGAAELEEELRGLGTL